MVAAGESLYLEFKHRLPESERIAREMAALANTSGGHLLIGVDDTGRLMGVKDPEEELYALKNALEMHCIPYIDFQHERIKVSRTRTVIVVKVPMSSIRPHYVQELSTQRKSVFVRFEDMCIMASHEARKLMSLGPKLEATLITLGEKERVLLKQLEEVGKITVRSFARYARIHPGRASRIMVRMTRARILIHHIDLNEDYFTAGSALSEN